MSEANKDEIKGRVKEAAGAVADDDDLKDEGKADQHAADVKDTVDDVADRAKDVVDDVTSRISGSD